MMDTQETTGYIETLKQQIEEKVAWGNSAQWTHQDFDQLSERIWEETQTKLSTTTLKRLWGKVNYQSQPATNTLNALAEFAGYEHWRDFVGRHELSQEAAATSEATAQQPVVTTSWWTGQRLALAISIPLLLVALFVVNRWTVHTDTFDGSAITFTSNPVTQGLPNTIVFRYDASLAPSDNIAIQQSWDKQLRASVAKNEDTYTTTYYYPGYFRAKLLVDDEIVKEHDLYLKSDGWMTIAEADPIPHYLSTQTSRDNYLQVPTDMLREKDILTRTEIPWINYYYVEEFGPLDANSFVLETRIKNDFAEGEAVCQTSQVNIICSKGHFSIPISIPGCVGELTMALGKKRLSGKTHDLSFLGTDPSAWQTLRYEVQNQRVKFFLNGQLVYEDEYDADVGKIAGLRYRFHGPGAIDYVRLRNGRGQIVYEEAFGGDAS